MSKERNGVEREVEKSAERLARAERERPTLLAQTAYVGVLGLLFVVPVVAGAYAGLWIDSLFAGYSMRWTLSLIVLGTIVGAVNVYFYIKE